MMLHPATAHFAIVLPMVASIIGMVYIIRKERFLAHFSTFAIVVTAIAIGVAWYSGNQAGPKIFEFLSADGKEELLEHKKMGLYLVISMGIIALIKIIGSISKRFLLEVVAIVAMFVISGAVLLQGKDGGEIVYEYGEPFESYKIKQTLKEAVGSAEDAEECDEKVELYEDAIDSLEEITSDLHEALGIKSDKGEEEE
ncbi:MAG: hypothetical protein GXO11_04140 [Epsilonproteobacteria bacterium]|nr:hypothetical protein [Campylobacterota bacterium]